jgi:L-aspartate oxidase
LHAELDPMPLLTEALRGEGAHLVDADGHRYMLDVHPDAELAPRDVVARENWLRRHHGPIYLDARMIGSDFPSRFPTVWAITQRAGLDPRTDVLPVSPAEHYHMGGIATDDRGRTSLAGLYACGEASSTGLHGANRLASNSLLEGLVFGARVAESMLADNVDIAPPGRASVPDTALELDHDLCAEAEIEQLRRTMWDNVGLVRDGGGLAEASAIIAGLVPLLAAHPVGRNLVDAARLVTDAAIARTESRGSHHRRDHPSPAEPAVHTTVHPVAAPSITIDLERQPSRAGA